MKFFSLLVAALLLTTASVSAEQIFVLFDGTCGDRVLYEQAIATQPRMDYYAYHFPLAGGDRLILETGAEGVTVQNFLPQGYIYCGDPRLSLELADKANNGVDRVFVLLPTQNNQYLIQPVVMAAVFQRQGARFSYFSPLTGYQFDTENGIIGENLAYDNPGARVYFEGRDNSPCSGYFLFRQLNPKSSYPVVDYKIAPEIGVYERRLGSDGKTTSGGVISVRTVNGVPIDNHLANVCAGAMAANNVPQPQVPGPVSGPATYNTQPVTPQPAPVTSAYPQPESAAAYAATTPVPASQVTHTVAKGETLYGVSRKYGTTVDAIKAQNGLTSNTVFVGQQLTVVSTLAPAPVTAPNPTAVALNQPPTTTVPTLPYNPGNIANSNPGSTVPTPYNGGTVQAPEAYGNAPKEGGAAVYGEDLHTVQPGETVASIALKHGFTSAKFREINGLGPNEFVKVGARLKTSDCNCPAPQPAAAAAAAPGPTAYGTAPAAGAPAPNAYGTAPAPTTPYGGVAAPRAYGAPAAVTSTPPTQPTGTPVGATAPTFRPATASPAAAAPVQANPRTIDNSPNFGQPVENASSAPTRTLRELESRGTTAAPTNRNSSNPATYGAYPAPLPMPAAAATPAPAPATYGSLPTPSPNAYGTPVGANYRAPTQPSNRSFHLVQEGESIFSISRRYGITTDELRQLNNLRAGDVIVPFQKLYVN